MAEPRDAMQRLYRSYRVPPDDRSGSSILAELVGKAGLVGILAILCGLTLAAAYPMNADVVASMCADAAAERGLEVSGYSISAMRWAPGWRCVLDDPARTVISHTTWVPLGIHLGTTGGAVAGLYAVLNRPGFTIVVAGGTLFYGLLALVAVQDGLSLILLVALTGMAIGIAGIVRKWTSR